MGRPSRDRELTDEAAVSRVTPAASPGRPPELSSLDWASAVGNQAVQRLARRTIAREAVEEEEVEEAAGLAALDDLPEDELPE